MADTTRRFLQRASIAVALAAAALLPFWVVPWVLGVEASELYFAVPLSMLGGLFGWCLGFAGNWRARRPDRLGMWLNAIPFAVYIQLVVLHILRTLIP